MIPDFRTKNQSITKFSDKLKVIILFGREDIQDSNGSKLIWYHLETRLDRGPQEIRKGTLQKVKLLAS